MSSNTQLQSWHTLLSDTGARLLSIAAKELAAGKNTADLQKILRRECQDTSLIASIITQTQLRHKASSKFGVAAANMLFTPAGLEQASSSAITRLYPQLLPQTDKLYDLGCGLGSASLAFKQAGYQVTGYEIDPLTAQFADHNLALVTGNTHQIVCASALDATVPAGAAVFCDPARRSGGHKNTQRLDPQNYSPDLDFVFTTARRAPGLVKLGPAFAHAHIPQDAVALWVSYAGSVRENLLLFNTPRPAGTYTAVVITDTQTHELTGAKDAAPVQTAPLGTYLYDPDGAVIRAGALQTLATLIGNTSTIDPQIAYLSSDKKYRGVFAQTFRILEVLPLRAKIISQKLRELGATSVEIKQRGCGIDPAKYRQQLRMTDAKTHTPKELTLVLTRIAGKHQAIICTRAVD